MANSLFDLAMSVPIETSHESAPLLLQPGGGGGQREWVSDPQPIFSNLLPQKRALIGQPQDSRFGSLRQTWRHSYAAWTDHGRRGQDRATWVEIQRKYNGSLTKIVDMEGSK